MLLRENCGLTDSRKLKYAASPCALSQLKIQSLPLLMEGGTKIQ